MKYIAICYFILGKSINFAENLVVLEQKLIMVDRKKKRLPHECCNIMQVRKEIDAIDMDIINLLSTRFAYVREVVKYKEHTEDGIEASDRRAAVINSRCNWADEAGLSPDVIGNIYNILIDYFIEEEKKIIQN